MQPTMAKVAAAAAAPPGNRRRLSHKSKPVLETPPKSEKPVPKRVRHRTGAKQGGFQCRAARARQGEDLLRGAVADLQDVCIDQARKILRLREALRTSETQRQQLYFLFWPHVIANKDHNIPLVPEWEWGAHDE